MFLGPRPAVLQAVDIGKVMRVIDQNERLVVLCCDNTVNNIRSNLEVTSKISVDKKCMILGICAAKG